ncbi:MAG: low-complexity tail membrane protein [Leptolyngbyaceae cyanobacterium CSU_1_4]|nr:low-complexity tail membrane protein [Leptolyngbyaceae cyanobacterium CSU_1_4]
MRSFRSDPYLWVHLAGVAAVPIFLELCLLGLGMGRFLMPVWFELLFVGGVGILPILWMQWQQPFYIFSLLLFALRPAQLSEDQRKLLGLFQSPVHQFLSVGVAVLMAGVLWRFYEVAPIANGLLFPEATRGTGLLVAAIAFFFANLFLQVPASVLRVLLVREGIFAATVPYPVEQISAAFTVVGFRVEKILPPLVPSPSKPVVIRPLPTDSEVAQKTEADLSEGVAELTVEEPIALKESEPEDTIDLPIGEAQSEEAIAASSQDPELMVEAEEFGAAIADQEPEAVMESEIIELELTELEITELEGVGWGNKSDSNADEIIEAVEIKVVEVEVIETVGETVSEEKSSEEKSSEEKSSEEKKAIAPEPVAEDWGDDEDLNDL